MLRLPEFQYLAPRELAEATGLLAEHGPQAMVVAGGTDLFPNMKRRQQEPPVVIGLRGVPELRAIQPTADGGVRLGAMLTLHELSERLARTYPALATAAGLVSTPHLRRMGTLGGNLCLDTRCTYYDQTYHWRKSVDFCKKKDGEVCWVAPGSARCWAVSSSDTAPVAIALGAKLRLASAGGERVVDAGAFFQDDGILYLTRRPDEILAWVELPPLEGWRTTYLKLRRRGSFDFPILGVAAAVKLSQGVVEQARLVLGAVGSSPVDQSAPCQPLIGQPPSLEAIDSVAQAASKGARPLDNTDLNYAWRKKMARVYVRRALAEACGVQLPAVSSRPSAPGGRTT
jgi:4-hydroxybenzoyl-CoA reductase subunit beta